MAKNQNVTSVTTAAGNNSLSASTAYTYDAVGNQLTVDGPLAGTADTTRYRYDADRRVIGTVSPDPDGAGALKDRANRITYRPDGQVSKKEIGTVTDQSDTAWNAFSVSQTVDIGFDTNFRPVTSKLSAGGTDYALTQTSYDALGRVDCTAVRMDRNQFTADTSLSACSLGTNIDPKDRITQNVYDAANQVTQIKVGLLTSDAATERTLTYTNNGKLQTIKDAENNLTTCVYDGFDRPSQTQYPSGTKGSGTSNASDYIQFSYDANGNVTSSRVRSGILINSGYDNLNRRISLTSSGLASRAYSYDNLARMLTATFQSSGQGVTNTYDALGRLASTSTNVGGTARTLSYAYDLAGRRARLTWWDGVYVDYDRLVTGELSAVRLNGATSGSGVLAALGYNDLGSRTSLTRGNGLVTSYAYDPLSRLQSLTHDLAGTASDLTIGSITYNPASQIVSAPKSNDAYAWNGHYNVNRPYTSNGLNQHLTAGSASFTYDTNGNLAADGTSMFVYDIENKLTSVTSAGSTKTFAYDPLNRLDSYVAGTGHRFIYDGAEAVAEMNGGTALLRRFVRGDGADEVLLEYVGSGTTDPRYHHLDERGSDIAWSDASGAMATISTYDEHGIPASTNPGRFQYTGQMWLPEIGVYNYKARVYSPTLGRFLQTDPIGYGDGPNWYAYAHNDPVNSADPSGTTVPTPEQIAQYMADGQAYAAMMNANPPRVTYGGCDTACSLSMSQLDSQMASSVLWGSQTSGYWACTNCNQRVPTTGGGKDGSPLIITGVRPNYVWVSSQMGMSVQVAGGTNPLGYSGQGAFLHWYGDQLVGGITNRSRTSQCDTSRISGSQVMEDTGEGGRGGFYQGLFLAVVGEILEPAGGGIPGAVRAIIGEGAGHAAGGAAAGGVGSAVEQACGG